MIIQKIDNKWYRAEQTIPNGILTYRTHVYASTAMKAINKLLRKEFDAIFSNHDCHASPEDGCITCLLFNHGN